MSCPPCSKRCSDWNARFVLLRFIITVWVWFHSRVYRLIPRVQINRNASFTNSLAVFTSVARLSRTCGIACAQKSATRPRSGPSTVPEPTSTPSAVAITCWSPLAPGNVGSIGAAPRTPWISCMRRKRSDSVGERPDCDAAASPSFVSAAPPASVMLVPLEPTNSASSSSSGLSTKRTTSALAASISGCDGTCQRTASTSGAHAVGSPHRVHSSGALRSPWELYSVAYVSVRARKVWRSKRHAALRGALDSWSRPAEMHWATASSEPRSADPVRRTTPSSCSRYHSTLASDAPVSVMCACKYGTNFVSASSGQARPIARSSMATSFRALGTVCDDAHANTFARARERTSSDICDSSMSSTSSSDVDAHWFICDANDMPVSFDGFSLASNTENSLSRSCSAQSQIGDVASQAA
mmetsp:Transcript_22051/g.77298  ORF Transcript_22051/g.77298 Transcript_22051/m.77298 type:complete len:412 (+) Transcript_22051:3059-4294(+)